VAAPGRRADPSVEQALFARGFEFDFFQAVRLLDRVYPRRRTPGGAAPPADEAVRFRAKLSLSFPPSAIDEIAAPADGFGPPSMTVAFFGLTGPQGVLPVHYTEWMMARADKGDRTFAAFLDLFNHRFASLLYRAWVKHRPPILYETAAVRDSRPDAFTRSLFDLIGMGTGGLQGRMSVRDEGLLRYAGLIVQRPASASAIRGILRDWFSVPVEIEQCVGAWYEIEDADRCYLAPETGRNQLGEGSFLGDEVWNQQARFRIRVGALTLERYLDFLPGGDAETELKDLTRLLVGQGMAFDLQLVLRAEEVPYCRLSEAGQDAPRLGWLGWLKTRDFQADAADAIFAHGN
jgi:type VI secretion system protein ImpH